MQAKGFHVKNFKFNTVLGNLPVRFYKRTQEVVPVL